MPSFGPVLNLADIIQVIDVCHADDQAGLNVHHYEVLTVSTTANVLSDFIAGYLTNDVKSKLKDCLSANAAFRGCVTRVVFPVLSPDFGDVTGAGVGTQAGDILPRQCSGFIRKKSAVAGKRKGGRFYVPFPSEENSSATGKPDAPYMTLLDALAIKLTSAITWGAGGLAVPVIWTRPDATAVPPVASGTRQIAAWVPVQKWATQRRRGSFGRINVPIV